MIACKKRFYALLVAPFILYGTPSQAHLIVAQSGTLNFVDGGAFLVLSMPPSAFSGIDENGDGEIAPTEVVNQLDAIKKQVHKGIELSDGTTGGVPLKGLLVSAVHLEENAKNPVAQLMILGRFAISDPTPPVSLNIRLYGEVPEEAYYSVAVKHAGRTQKFLFSKETAKFDVVF